MRTIITAGHRADYTFEEVRYDDYTLDYTRQQEGLSPDSEAIGNPVIVMNPSPLQMNTAFSKAYLLDMMGSAVGIEGPHYYIEHSFISYIEQLVENSGEKCRVLQREAGENLLFAVDYVEKKTNQPRVFGIVYDPEVIKVDDRRLSTTLYRVLGFYPHDENPDEFCWDLPGCGSSVQRFPSGEFPRGFRLCSPEDTA